MSQSISGRSTFLRIVVLIPCFVCVTSHSSTRPSSSWPIRNYVNAQSTTDEVLLHNPLWIPGHMDIVSLLFQIRSGGYQEFDQQDMMYSDVEYDHDEDDVDIGEELMDDAETDEGAAMHQHRRDVRNHPAANGQFRAPPGGRQYPPTNNDRPAIPRRLPPKKRKGKSSNMLAKVARTSLKYSQKAAMTTVKTSGKAAFYLVRPKNIQESELWGTWRLDQQVMKGNPKHIDLQRVYTCSANVELTCRRRVIIRQGDDIVWESNYKWTKPRWPQAGRIEFEARAFQPSETKSGGQPWKLFYRGYLERKWADRDVIKIVGKLYEIEHPRSMFGKKLPTRYHKIGTFVGRQRINLREDNVENDDDVEDYDDAEFEPEGGKNTPQQEKEGRDEKGSDRSEEPDHDDYDEDQQNEDEDDEL